MLKKNFIIVTLLFTILAAIACAITNSPVTPSPTETQNHSTKIETLVPTVTATIAQLVALSPTVVETPINIIEELPPTPTANSSPVSTAPTPTPAHAETPSPTPAAEITPIQITVSCGDIDTNWGQDWPAVLNALDQLITANQSCGEEPLPDKKYAAHFSYAVSLENSGNLERAIEQYQAALLLNPNRNEALDALLRLNALPEPTPVACNTASLPNPDPSPSEDPDLSRFVTAQGDQLYLSGQPFKVKGVNYYPRRAPWHHFLEKADLAEVTEELDTIKAAGFNTIRVFLRYEPLFICQPEDAIPNETAFAKVDTLFQLASDRNLKLIVTLNDLPDLVFRPLYKDWSHYDAQTVYIVRRYRNQSNILAWDLRNEGDLDYGVRPGDEARFSQDEVLAWLAHISQLVHENDPHHLLTAGWWGDPSPTSPFVDILSFHHWFEADHLQARIIDYKQQNAMPLMLQEVGYHSWAEAPHDQRDVFGQADILGRTVNVAETENISGWVVWTAFDFVPQPGQPHNFEHFFGLWDVGLNSKPALEALPLQ